MCGVYASVGFAPDRRRIDMVSHRGPDGSGWREYTSASGPVALGHRRLAIIDVSDAGLQPLADATGRFQLIFNGEIYNYLELRNELEARGDRFATDTDSEVLLASYRRWGAECLNRLLGMFAFLVWDERDQRLFAARDRFGIKPLYVVSNKNGIAFASEIKQLLGLAGVSRRMNLARVRDFLEAGISDHTGETLFEGVSQLQPGCFTEIDASVPWRGEWSSTRWYAIPPASTLDLSETDAAERFRDLLTESVRMHLRSDVPVGSCLSGGLDSSSIVCLMSEMLQGDGSKLSTVSACYNDKSVDEKPFMQAVVEQTGAVPHYIYPRAEDVFQKASDITWHQDEPFGSTSIFAQWCVFEEARRAGIKVMLDGQGADEQLAGYHASYSYYMADLIRRGDVLNAVRTIVERRRVHGVSFFDQVKRFLGPVLPSPIRQVVLRQRQVSSNYDWLASPAMQSLGSATSALETASLANGLPPVTDIASLCVVLTFASNLQMLLHWEDRNSMAHSIEARVPFLDHRLVEFNLALGNAHKIVRSDTKRVLRRAMSHALPATVRERRDKLGFSTPEQAWFRGPLRGMMEEGVEATLGRFPDLLNPAGARKLCVEMLSGTRPVDFTLWRVVNLGIWGERFGVTL